MDLNSYESRRLVILYVFIQQIRAPIVRVERGDTLFSVPPLSVAIPKCS